MFVNTPLQRTRVCADYNYSFVQTPSADPPLAAAAVARQPSEAEPLKPCCANLQFSRPMASRVPALLLLLSSPPISTAAAVRRSWTTTISSEPTAAAPAIGSCGCGVVSVAAVVEASSTVPASTVIIAAVCLHCLRDRKRAASRIGYNYNIIIIRRTTVSTFALATAWPAGGGDPSRRESIMQYCNIILYTIYFIGTLRHTWYYCSDGTYP